MISSIIVISIGASLGAISRWLLGLSLNSLFPTLPMGTLIANLLGGYLIGVALTFAANNPQLPPEWRLMVVTGFFGGLTTFSIFSAEICSLLQEGRLIWAAIAATHVLGSLFMTLLGMASVTLLQRVL